MDFLKFQSPEQNLRIDIARIRVYNKACRRVCHIKRSTQNLPRGHSSLVEYQLPKLRRRVRFPLSAPVFTRVRFSLSFLIMREISSGDISRIKKQTPQGLLLLYSHSVSSVCSDSYKIDILPLCAEFRFVLGQKSAGFFGIAADFRMPAGIRHSS